ncbi:yippee-domain-containing protein [Pholiota conissans]|uniref:Yippee-domain-containing protein n=1 Tax=Pholiota conissans TaxID=109636 RepID=A0A9P5YU87_9AGAR|nr:yippee-domain-containing protein [Pholiota conissans]
MSAEYSNYPSTSRLSPNPNPRRLPAPPTITSKDAKRTSRPLPKIPRALVCKQCGTCITSHNVLLPSSSIPPNSRAFRGFIGKASLFTEIYNVNLAKPGVQLMATGAHTMQEITCATCSTYVGWKIVRAHESSETWKEGYFLLELENLHLQTDLVDSANMSPNPRRTSSSGSDSDGL